MFDRIASTYDELNRLMSFSLDLRWRRRALDHLDARDGNIVLDAASGTGDMALLASRRRLRLVGLDLSRRMMSSAVSKWSAGRREAEFSPVQGDASALPFQDGAFDRAMVAFGIRNMPDVPAFLAEAFRVLRPGGRLVILEMSVPTLPVVREVFLLYLRSILPLVAGIRGGDRAAYRYLSDSIIAFPPPERIEAMAEAAGFRVRSSEALTLGSCHLYVVDRAEDERDRAPIAPRGPARRA
jgi:demethylmenaquinone methyltransferase/2-methoxy-6-polyprenyl-1,4-benzoquinol methylase